MDRLKAQLDEIWRENVGLIRSRLAVVEAAVRAAGSGKLDRALAERAEIESHKLAGVLANFGLKQATEDARWLEEAFTTHIEGNPLDLSELRGRAESVARAIADRG